MEFKFRCLMCGRCCHEVSGTKDDPTYKRIPLYPEEAVRLEKLAEKHNITLHLIEDVVFPDIKNEKILVLTWRILLDNKEKVCPFHSNDKGCIIQDQKPLACLAYPLSLQTIDAFNTQIQIDPLCKFTIENYDVLKNINAKKLKQIYDLEYPRAQKMLNRNKKAILKIRILEQKGKIQIPKEIDCSDFNKYLKEWDRIEIDSISEDISI
ncbi:MAG: YkgJ family cysteine cluster protein [Promethearchaeota archaeon]